MQAHLKKKKINHNSLFIFHYSHWGKWFPSDNVYWEKYTEVIIFSHSKQTHHHLSPTPHRIFMESWNSLLQKLQS